MRSFEEISLRLRCKGTPSYFKFKIKDESIIFLWTTSTRTISKHALLRDIKTLCSTYLTQPTQERLLLFEKNLISASLEHEQSCDRVNL